ncbi:MAG: enoyl-CoA hydratase/isomerase family protein [Solirubrobacterales bacterium]
MDDALTTYERDGNGVGLLRLDRPASRNAINTQMLEELLAHLEAARADEDLRVLVLSSTDHMGFSAGADVREDLDREGAIRRMQLFADLYDGLTGFPRPTIAACHGACVGGGAEIAVSCDLRVGGSNMRLRFPGAGLGVPVGPARLVTLCGLSVAKYLLLTSKEIAVDEAFRWGIVHKVAPAPRTEEVALQLATQISEHPPESVSRIKEMLHAWDGVEDRSRAEGEGQVEWQSEGPGLGYRD